MSRPVLLLIAALIGAPALAQSGGKLLLTGGVSSIDGAAGGGLTPWALTGSYATAGEIGATAFATRVRTGNYGLWVYGASVSAWDRVELSVARQDFDTRNSLALLGLQGLHLKQDIFGAKVRIAGDAVLDSDTLMPQLAVGVEHKKADVGDLQPVLMGAIHAKGSGTDVYLSATKLFLAPGMLVNLTLRATQANQNGLLGFGQGMGGGTKVQPEVSLAKLLRRDLAVGVEYRAKPDNLNRTILGGGALKEDDWKDVFIAWAPNKHFSLTAAWVDLGHIAPAAQPKRQDGAYLSAQFAL
jgi:hypothetical protein